MSTGPRRPHPVTIPDDHVVWAATDLHGQLAAVDRLLAAAGLTDGADRWLAPPRTTLVVTGDVVDRGPDPVGLVRRLVRLRDRAPDLGGLVVLLEGNHEVQVLGGLAGEPALSRALVAFGGGATLSSAGLAPDEWEAGDPVGIAARVDELAPDLRPALRTFAPYARWRDVLLVHAGPVPDRDLATFEAGAERLWIRDDFFASPHPFPDAAPWRAYRAAGLGRVVFGHTPVVAPTTSHGGRALDLDTWRGGLVTIARLTPDGDLGGSAFIAEPVERRVAADAALDPDEIVALDRALPTLVAGWWGAGGR